ncbi:MAG: cation diffusion facilitator family transporter [bacterium]|nr:cation diffusion facilitator family transporter [bacterium]
MGVVSSSFKETAAAMLNTEAAAREKQRNATIVKASAIGIAANVLLAAFKAAVGLAANSIAIVMDAVNNLSDAASSIITIAGTKLASKRADKKHPFGYGRIEYLSAMVISLLVLYAGVTAFIESVKVIMKPAVPEYSAVTLSIVAVAVVVKILLGRYSVKVGESVNSDALVNSGEDAKLDAVISAATLVAAVIYIQFHIALEAWLGALIALVIVKAGLEMLGDTLSQVLGENADNELSKKIKETLTSHEEVQGAYDLILHNYGPDTFNGSVHIEVYDTLTADQIDKLTRQLAGEVYHAHNVVLTAIGIYSINTSNQEVLNAREKLNGIIASNPYILHTHGFYFNPDEKSMRFDLVISFDAPDSHQVFREVLESVQKEYPDYTIQANIDMDFGEEANS